MKEYTNWTVFKEWVLPTLVGAVIGLTMFFWATYPVTTVNVFILFTRNVVSPVLVGYAIIVLVRAMRIDTTNRTRTHNNKEGN